MFDQFNVQGIPEGRIWVTVGKTEIRIFTFSDYTYGFLSSSLVNSAQLFSQNTLVDNGFGFIASRIGTPLDDLGTYTVIDDFQYNFTTSTLRTVIDPLGSYSLAQDFQYNFTASLLKVVVDTIGSYSDLQFNQAFAFVSSSLV